ATFRTSTNGRVNTSPRPPTYSKWTATWATWPASTRHCCGSKVIERVGFKSKFQSISRADAPLTRLIAATQIYENALKHALPSSDEGSRWTAGGKGGFQLAAPISMEGAPLPSPLPARASQGEGAGSF